LHLTLRSFGLCSVLSAHFMLFCVLRSFANAVQKKKAAAKKKAKKDEDEDEDEDDGGC
jgi:hypothetical protein